MNRILRETLYFPIEYAMMESCADKTRAPFGVRVEPSFGTIREFLTGIPRQTGSGPASIVRCWTPGSDSPLRPGGTGASGKSSRHGVTARGVLALAGCGVPSRAPNKSLTRTDGPSLTGRSPGPEVTAAAVRPD